MLNVYIHILCKQVVGLTPSPIGKNMATLVILGVSSMQNEACST